MAIEGPLRELGIHDVFQLLDLSRKTGCLRVTSAMRDNAGEVWFRDGRVVAAAMRANPYSLGSFLVAAGVVRADDVARAAAAQQRPGETRRLGELLVALGALGAPDLEREVRRQVEAVVFELLSWEEGHFSFTEQPADAPGAEAVTSIATEALLMEGARRIDEWARLQARVPHVGVVPTLAEVGAEGAGSLALLPAEWEVLAAIDGQADVRTVAARLGRSDFDVARTLFGLVAIGVVVVREPAVQDVAEQATAAGALCAETRAALEGGRFDAALATASSAVVLAPADPEARYLLARAQLGARRSVEGEESLRRVLELAPGHVGALMTSARVALARGDLPGAAAAWKRVQAGAPGTAAAARASLAWQHAVGLQSMLEGADA